jgi:hypothetical protein
LTQSGIVLAAGCLQLAFRSVTGRLRKFPPLAAYPYVMYDNCRCVRSAFAGRFFRRCPIRDKNADSTENGKQMTKTPIDRRVARSRDLLHRALRSLIVEKGYDALTVEEICERANVGRSTFYAHFTSKDDLKRRGLEYLRRELIEQQKTASSLVDAHVRGLTFASTMFEHARDHLHLYRALVGVEAARSR